MDDPHVFKYWKLLNVFLTFQKENFVSFMRALEPPEDPALEPGPNQSEANLSKNIVRLSDQNFTSMINNYPNMIAYFYKPGRFSAMQDLILIIILYSGRSLLTSVSFFIHIFSIFFDSRFLWFCSLFDRIKYWIQL